MNNAMNNAVWKVVETFSDEISAQSLQQCLELDGIPSVLRSDSSLLGIARTCLVLVPEEFLQRARWLLGAGALSDEELDFLATGVKSH